MLRHSVVRSVSQLFAASKQVRRISSRTGIPVIGLGTSQMYGDELKTALHCAIGLGYRHIDCAAVYYNERIIGDVLKENLNEGIVNREDLYIVSKLSPSRMRPSMVREACRQSLADLKVDYVDLYLIHLPTSLIPEFPWPLRNQNIKWNEYYDDVDYLDTWKEMEALCHEGCCKAIGLSNFSQRQVERIMQHSSLPVAAIQVECNPYLTRSGLLDFCKANKIAFVAHSPLGSPGGRPWMSDMSAHSCLLRDPTILEIAKNHQRSSAQIILRFHIQRGGIAVPKSSHPGRLKENLKVSDFDLLPNEMDDIEQLNRNLDCGMLDGYKGHHHYPYKSEDDLK